MHGRDAPGTSVAPGAEDKHPAGTERTKSRPGHTPQITCLHGEDEEEATSLHHGPLKVSKLSRNTDFAKSNPNNHGFVLVFFWMEQLH